MTRHHFATAVFAFVVGMSAISVAGQAAPVQAPKTQTPAPTPPPMPERQLLGTQTTDYVVGPADVIKITVFNEDQLTGSFRVDTDGTITYPMLGRHHVAGRTAREIETVLTKLLEDGFVRRPTVAVEVQDFRSRTIFIVGEVRTAGKYPLQGDMTLLEALALAGSVTSNASNEIRVIRPRDPSAKKEAAQPDADVNAEEIKVDLKALEEGKVAGNVVLQDGDTVIVGRAERFYISGHVRTPGSYVIDRGMTVQQAIAVAGGMTERGSTRGIKVRRENPNKPGEFVEVDVRLTDRVVPGDTIVVRQRRI
ncbi:MAG TPA: SLBB domain-containing protein [Vicinamibacterales bacterium]|nr:SLBB domain-containing protein [Vicinamibacterales bacterium]